MSESRGEALATLVYAVQERKDFITLTGESARARPRPERVLQKLGTTMQTAYISTRRSESRTCSPRSSRISTSSRRAVPRDGAALAAEHHLIDRLRQDLQTLLIINEAQNLSDAMLKKMPDALGRDAEFEAVAVRARQAARAERRTVAARVAAAAAKHELCHTMQPLFPGTSFVVPQALLRHLPSRGGTAPADAAERACTASRAASARQSTYCTTTR